MERYNRILYRIVIGILTVLLLSILYTSIVIYPPFAFISYHTSQEKVVLIRKLIVPSIVILLCILLEYFHSKKMSTLSLGVTSITLLSNIITGLLIDNFDTVNIVYFISGINFNLVPICLLLLYKNTVKIKLPKVICYIFLSLIVLIYIIFIITIFSNTYVTIIGFMYLGLPIIILSNIIAFINFHNKVLDFQTIAVMYIINFSFSIYNAIWYIGELVMVVLNILVIFSIIIFIIFAIIMVITKIQIK